MRRKTEDALASRIREMVLGDFESKPAPPAFASKPLWSQIRHCGSELWLDTGDMEEIAALWSTEFSALTTNNTLLNKEVQKGIYDGLIAKAAKEMRTLVSGKDLVLEIAFVLNAYHAMRLNRQFGAMVSVELHTDLTNDVERLYYYGRRYHEIAPESFYIKVGHAPAGLVAARRLAEDGVPVNYTLGFSARQNYLIAAFARPYFVNVFLGRLNSFLADNGLGNGELVGEKATLASQRGVKELRSRLGLHTRQIAASLREGHQVATLAGVDVMTIPPKIAREFEALKPPFATIIPRTGEDPDISLAPGIDRKTLGIDALWEVPEDFKRAVLELLGMDASSLSPEDIVEFFDERGYRALFPDWSPTDIETVAADGKIPKYERWENHFARGEMGLDALMNISGLYSFDTDQKAMDERIKSML